MGARVIAELPRATDQYWFSHALIRETLYEELSTTRRVRLHRQIGEALEELDAEGNLAATRVPLSRGRPCRRGHRQGRALRRWRRRTLPLPPSHTKKPSSTTNVPSRRTSCTSHPTIVSAAPTSSSAWVMPSGGRGGAGPSRLVPRGCGRARSYPGSPERLAMAALGMGGGFSDFDTGEHRG